MAEDEDKKDDDKEAKPAGNKKLIIILAVVFSLLTITSVALVVVFMGSDDEAPTEEVAEEGEDGKKKKKEEPKEDFEVDLKNISYFELEPIVVNFKQGNRGRFLQVKITLMVRNEKFLEAVKLHDPWIRNDLIGLFSRQSYKAVQSFEGKEKLREQALVVVRKIMKQETGHDGVEQVLFTSFIME